MSTLGRPVTFDEEKQIQLCTLISAGCNVKHAAQFVGVSTRTIRRHAEQNEAFRQRLRNAEASIRLKALETVRKAAASDWRAAIWLVKNGGALEGPPESCAARQEDEYEELMERPTLPKASTKKSTDLHPLRQLAVGQKKGKKPRGN